MMPSEIPIAAPTTLMPTTQPSITGNKNIIFGKDKDDFLARFADSKQTMTVYVIDNHKILLSFIFQAISNVI